MCVLVANIVRARIPSLFSDFTVQRDTNPDGYNANVKIWEDILCSAARDGFIAGRDGTVHRLSLETGPYLLQKLESSEWGRPLAINAVIVDQKVAGRVLTALEKYSSQVDRTLTTAMFGREAAATLGIDGDLGDKDLTILLKYLARDRKTIATDGKVVRIIGSTDDVSPISTEDRAIASLKSLIEDIERQLRALESQIAASRERSQKAVESKNRASALMALRSKKLAESVLAQRMDTLFQLEQVLSSIQQASDQVAMVRVMKDSAGVLRGLNAKVGSAEDVENALESLKEEMGKVEDLGSVISDAGQEVNVTDEHEIDEEFDALLRQKERAEEEEAVERTKQKLAELQTEKLGADGEEKSELSTGESQIIPTANCDPTSPKLNGASVILPSEGQSASSAKSNTASHNPRESSHAILES
ncbi:MAG: hypothetical protein Q9198_006692 [Flavoplaca austrocitrina]